MITFCDFKKNPCQISYCQILSQRRFNHRGLYPIKPLDSKTTIRTKNTFALYISFIRFRDQVQNRTIEFLTHDFALDAFTISQIYKASWEIEFFVKTIKQHLRIKWFIGTSSNAFWTQICITMLAYLLVSYFKFVNC